jgi:hypothetical protein
MPVGMQALFGGGYDWKIDSTPDSVMVVGSTITTQQPKQFLIDTEKYSNQVQLVKLPQGSYTIKGYVAGLPFPNLTEPDLAAKAYFNAYYEYRPFVSWYNDPGWLVDRYHNMTASFTEVTAFRLSHLSDPAYPTNPPFGKPTFFPTVIFSISLSSQSTQRRLPCIVTIPRWPRSFMFSFLLCGVLSGCQAGLDAARFWAATMPRTTTMIFWVF